MGDLGGHPQELSVSPCTHSLGSTVSASYMRINMSWVSCKKRNLGAVKATQKTLRVTDSPVRFALRSCDWGSAILSLSVGVPERSFPCLLGLGVTLFEMNVGKRILVSLLTLKFRESGE